jgi:hypothetical protein
MTSVLGITIDKTKLILTQDHLIELRHTNIGTIEHHDKYILYCTTCPHPIKKQEIQHLKGILTRIRNDDIYNNYNDDFGLHTN